MVEREPSLYLKYRTLMMNSVWNSINLSLKQYQNFTNHEWYANFVRQNVPTIFDGLQYMPQNSLVEGLNALKIANMHSGTWLAIETLCVACFGQNATIERVFNLAEKWKFSINISNISSRFIYTLASASVEGDRAVSTENRAIASIDTISIFSYDLRNFLQRYVSPDEELEAIIFI